MIEYRPGSWGINGLLVWGFQRRTSSGRSAPSRTIASACPTTFAFRRFHSSRPGGVVPGAGARRQTELQDLACYTVGLAHRRGCTKGIAGRFVRVLQHRRRLAPDRLVITRLDRLHECLEETRRVALLKLVRFGAKLCDDTRSRARIGLLRRLAPLFGLQAKHENRAANDSPAMHQSLLSRQSHPAMHDNINVCHICLRERRTGKRVLSNGNPRRRFAESTSSRPPPIDPRRYRRARIGRPLRQLPAIPERDNGHAARSKR